VRICRTSLLFGNLWKNGAPVETPLSSRGGFHPRSVLAHAEEETEILGAPSKGGLLLE